MISGYLRIYRKIFAKEEHFVDLLQIHLAELKKKNVDIKPRKTQELLKKEFEDSINKINPLIEKIKETDNEIDQMVYDLYSLTPEFSTKIEKSSIKYEFKLYKDMPKLSPNKKNLC